MKKRVFLGVAIAVALVLGGMFGRLWAQQHSSTLMGSLALFSRVLDLVLSTYVEQVDGDKLIRESIRGMLGGLDPYSEFLDETDYKELRVKTEGRFGGIGIHIGTVDGELAVIAPIEGTPAERAGIRGGDRIAEIDGKSTEGFTTEDAVKVLRGEPGTNVTVGVDRPGAPDLLEFKLTRAIINIRAVPYAGLVAPGVGFIRLADFSRVATGEVKQAIDSLTEAGASRFILDLRQNGGGLLREGTDVSDLFLPPGRLIVRTAGRMPESKNDFDAETEEQCGGRPLAVLVDRGSASAAEIVAGALQDWERAVLVGETTFGKGSVQTISQLGPEFGVKITTAYWYTPSGRCINRKRDKDSSVVSDTIEKPGPEYRTLGSLRRSLYGGGGIAPDLVVPYEKLSGLAVRITRDAYFDYAVSYVNAHPGTTPSFSAGDAVLTDFSQFLATTKELSFRPAEFDSSREYIAEQIEVEVAGKLRGVRGEYQVRLRHDPQVRRAVELLNAASSTGQILRGLD